MFGQFFSNHLKNKEVIKSHQTLNTTGEPETISYRESSFYEIKTVRQDHPGFRKRWFATENCSADLYIWEETISGQIVQFQFCYDCQRDEKVVEWKAGEGLRFASVQTNQEHRLHKATPVLLNIAILDLHEAFMIFRYHANVLRPDIRAFIERRLAAGGPHL